MLFKRVLRHCTTSLFSKRKGRTIYTATIYTDGSFYSNRNPNNKAIIKSAAGIGIYFPNGEHYNVCEKINAVSSNYSEMMAIYRAIKICDLLKINGIIYTDSEYAIQKINYKHCGILLHHVKAHRYLHSSIPGHDHSVGNAIADTLAKYGSKM